MNQSWRERALERSQIITDAWEVAKAYAGRIAEWVLYICMIANIIEILVEVPVAFSYIVLGTQVVMLDVGGFSLASMADHARDQGDERAAHRASRTGYFLIGITILTLTLFTVGILFAPAKRYTDDAEKILILVRVIMTVIYGHVIHSLRRAETGRKRVETQVDELAKTVNQQITQLGQTVATIEQNLTFHVHQLQGEMQRHSASFSSQFRGEIQTLSDQLLTLNSLVESLQKSEEISQDSNADLHEESDEDEEPGTPTEAGGAKGQRRKYSLTFEEVSELTGLSILQLNRHVKMGKIEVNSHGKIRAKSLQNLQQNSNKRSSQTPKDSPHSPALRLVRK
jgi:hypothetical protein